MENDTIQSNDLLEEIIILEEISTENKKETKTSFLKKFEKLKKLKPILNNILFIIKYSITSIFIFFVLLLTTNYSAYLNIAKWYLYEDELEIEAQSMVTSVEAWSNVEEKKEEKEEIEKEEKQDKKTQAFKEEEIKEENDQRVFHSINKLIAKSNENNINLNIDITPYENRVIIPKIWKNIPLIEVENREVNGLKELNNIFMKELSNGIIRYPSSWIPGEKWNSFIFWHSSNFPWIKWEYNDVFALLDKVELNDEVIVYYDQKKFKYKIREKKVVKPSNVQVLKDTEDKSEITIMTCWPVWTTLNRLIVVWDLVEEEK